MYVAHIHCSDCPEEVEVLVDELHELDGLACECGYGFVLESVAEADLVSVTPAVVVRIHGDDLPLAA
jgi:DNA-directed RNA polymerase subunit RPC12/RpoP